MHKALADSNVSTKDILAIKAHGTATLLNDEGEAAAMRQVFDSVPDFFIKILYRTYSGRMRCYRDGIDGRLPGEPVTSY